LRKTIHQFFPIDNFIIIKKFINYWKPSVLFLCESEIWPNLIDEIKKRNIKLVLINGRMTLRSYLRWKKIKNFSKSIYKKFDLCFAQNDETFKRLKFLGAKNVVKLGNLKFATSKKVKYDFLEKKYYTFFKKKRILITAASTHFNEENFRIQNHLYFKVKNFLWEI
jgi:3-deoxy-D-manno-octulosonic-acid transferase